MNMIRKLLLIFIILLPKTSQATVGFAEWFVYTPGGNIIRHQDGWKGQYGDCLTADNKNTKLTLSQRHRVYISHMKYWQYYTGYVVGKSRKGYFLFNEKTKKENFFQTEQELKITIKKLNLGDPISIQLKGGDGWVENWFPLEVWPECHKFLSNKTKSEKLPSEESKREKDCKKAFEFNRIKHYPYTTWGRECPAFKEKLDNSKESLLDEQKKLMLNFCEFISSIKK